MLDKKDENEEKNDNLDNLIDSIDTTNPQEMRPIYEGFTIDKGKLDD